ncbi:hypothetical protein V6N13_013186 [Hibiscus sabdariffa]|uniref:Uncharacterized protein n=1 Tax=Hibiscus sabdariffa TaxID=183260 RepID=A0ABR2SH87_9ROSI
MFNLDVDFHLLWRLPPHSLTSFMDVMQKLLFFHTDGRIEHFRLNHISISGMNDSNVCGWIFAALWRGVKEIELVFTRCSSCFPMLPTALLFTSKTLGLGVIKFEDGDSVKRLISSCPVLEDLSIFHCGMQNIRSLKISHPSLKRPTIAFQWFPSTSDIVFDLSSLVYFKYVCFTSNNHLMRNMPCLVRAEADIDISSRVRGRLYDGHGLVEIFLGLTIRNRNTKILLCIILLIHTSLPMRFTVCSFKWIESFTHHSLEAHTLNVLQSPRGHEIHIFQLRILFSICVNL